MVGSWYNMALPGRLQLASSAVYKVRLPAIALLSYTLILSQEMSLACSRLRSITLFLHISIAYNLRQFAPVASHNHRLRDWHKPGPSKHPRKCEAASGGVYHRHYWQHLWWIANDCTHR